MNCNKCGAVLENNKDDKKLIILSRICLFSLIADILFFGLCFVVEEKTIFLLALLSYLIQLISAIILIVKYPQYKYSKLFLFLAIIATVIYIAIIVISIIIIGKCLIVSASFGHDAVDALNSCYISG